MQNTETIKRKSSIPEIVYYYGGGYITVWVISALLNDLFSPVVGRIIHFNVMDGLLSIFMSFIMPFFIIKAVLAKTRNLPSLFAGISSVIGSSFTVWFINMIDVPHAYEAGISVLSVITGAAFGWMIAKCYSESTDWSQSDKSPVVTVLTAVCYGYSAGWVKTVCFHFKWYSGFSDDRVDPSFLIPFAIVSLIYIVGKTFVNKEEMSAYARGEAKYKNLYEEADKKAKKEEEARKKAENERDSFANDAREWAYKAKAEWERANRAERGHAGNKQAGGDRSSQRQSRQRTSNNRNEFHFFSGCRTKEDLHRLYREMCKKYHPDNNNGDADTFKRMNAEYDRLRRQMSA